MDVQGARPRGQGKGSRPRKRVQRGFQELGLTHNTFFKPEDRYASLKNDAPSANHPNFFAFAVDDDSSDDDSAASNDGEADTFDANGNIVAAVPNPVPQISRWRMNLAALSQHTNLFFIAFGERIHVIQPQGQNQYIPTEPDLILHVPQSPRGKQVGGFCDVLHPHHVNHLMVGDFGDDEILLYCCDDGDVISFSVRSIFDRIQTASQDRGNQDHPYKHSLRPWLHENVDKSAWGLAIHKESRLIAVSSNRWEMTVFVCAIEDESPERRLRSASQRDEIEERKASRQEQYVADKQTAFPVLEDGENKKKKEDPLNAKNKRNNLSIQHVRRCRNYRLVMKLGPEGDNIPFLGFTSNPYGEADRIVAKDIKGKVWAWDFWHRSDPYVMISGQSSLPVQQQGWGVLALTESSFLETSTQEKTFGMRSPPRQEGVIDISLSLHKMAGHVPYPIGGADIDWGELGGAPVPPLADGMGDFGDGGPIEDSEDDEDDDKSNKKASPIQWLGLSTPGQEADVAIGGTPGHAIYDADGDIIGAFTVVMNAENHPHGIPAGFPDVAFVPSGPETQAQITIIADATQEALVGAFFEGQLNENPARRAVQMIQNIISEIAPLRNRNASIFGIPGALPTTPQTGPKHKFNSADTIIFHTSRWDISLVPLLGLHSPFRSKEHTHIICKNATRAPLPAHQLRLGGLQRINMLLHIPELNLVIAAAQLGKIALITLTKTDFNRAPLTMKMIFDTEYKEVAIPGATKANLYNTKGRRIPRFRYQLPSAGMTPLNPNTPHATVSIVPTYISNYVTGIPPPPSPPKTPDPSSTAPTIKGSRHQPKRFKTQPPEIQWLEAQRKELGENGPASKKIKKAAKQAIKEEEPNWVYSMRVDHVLPFSSMQQRGLGPKNKELAGLAAGPVNVGEVGGMRGGKRRWRVVAYYRDHSVCSWEVWRGSEGLVVGGGGGAGGMGGW